MAQNTTNSEPRNNELVQRLVEEISGMLPGAIITWLNVGQMTGITDRIKLYPIMARVRKELIVQKGYFLDTVPKIGYEILVPGKEINYCRGVQVKGIKTIRRSIVMSNHIRVAEIPEAIRNETLTMQNKMANVFGLLRQIEV